MISIADGATGATQSAHIHNVEYWTLSNSCEMVRAHGAHRSHIYFYCCCWERLFRTKLGFLLCRHLYFWGHQSDVRIVAKTHNHTHKAQIFNNNIHFCCQFSISAPRVQFTSKQFFSFLDKLTKRYAVLDGTRSEVVATAHTHTQKLLEC